MKTRLLYGLIIGLAIALCCGCQRPSEQAFQQNYITIKGSDTMVHLVTAWAESYMQKCPEVNISVTGGGSGTGIAAMINGTTDIAMASRKFKQKEFDLAKKQGITPVEHITALDGIAVVVNADNPVGELTLEQLKQIFTGAAANWKQVGGDDRLITVLSRESNSGTYVYFQKAVLKKQDYAQQARLMPSSAAIIQSVEQDTGVIGYVGVAYAENSKAKIIKVKKTFEAQAVSPTMENIKSGGYPISRPLHLYIKSAPTGEIKKFLGFIFSVEGQNIVREIGYVPIS